MNYAGFWIRTLATSIDVIILMMIITPLLYLIYGDAYLAQLAPTEEMKSSLGFWDTFINYMVPVVFTLYFWQKFAATPAKMLLGLKVVDAETGANINFRQSIIRYVGYYVAMLPLLLGVIWVVFDKRKQGWHDKMAGTVVIRK